jgi:LacI family transcriptional regulator
MAGVSVGTVSNVLNHAHLVREEKREQVEAAIERLNFVRSEPARQLRAGRSRMVGLLVLDVTNPFFTDLARGAEEAISASGLSVMLCDSNADEAKQDRYLTLLAEQRVYGVLIVPVGPYAAQMSRLRERRLPFVLLDTKSSDKNVCSVSVDDVGGGRMAVNHLLDQGHESIAFVSGKGRERQVADRAAGARRALRQAGVRDLTVIRAAGLNVAGGRDAGRQLLAMPAFRRPTAAFCSNDLLALGLLQELTREGYRVPNDMAIVGYDDIEFASSAAVPLSSVRQHCQEMGRTAAALLLEEASGEPHIHQRVVLETELVIRSSSENVVHRGRARANHKA